VRHACKCHQEVGNDKQESKSKGEEWENEEEEEEESEAAPRKLETTVPVNTNISANPSKVGIQSINFTCNVAIRAPSIFSISL